MRTRMAQSRYFIDARIDKAFERMSVVVLDLNGLLVDDEPAQRAATNKALTEYGVSFSIGQWETYCVGRSALEYLPEFVPRITPEEVGRVLKLKNKAYDTLIRISGGAAWKPGAIALLSWLIQCEIPRALATSTSRDNLETLDRVIGLQKSAQFEFTVCGDEVERAKPDPSIYLAVQQALGEDRLFLAVEDSTAGLCSAVGAGMRCILVPSLPRQEISKWKGAHLVISSLEADARVLQGLCVAGP
jgi:beta-phosphoglucomutase-like phosphatase (HAD superfamily)